MLMRTTLDGLFPPPPLVCRATFRLSPFGQEIPTANTRGAYIIWLKSKQNEVTKLTKTLVRMVPPPSMILWAFLNTIPPPYGLEKKAA